MKLLQTINPKRSFSFPLLTAGIAAARAAIIHGSHSYQEISMHIPSLLSKLISRKSASLCAAGCLTVALIPCFAAVPQSSQRVQGRRLPDCSNHLDESGILILSGTCLYTGAATKLADAWHAEGTELQVFDSVLDGVLVNRGPSAALLISVDGLSIYTLEPDESIVVGPDATTGYTRGCICMCGTGKIFISAGNCGGSNCACPTGGLPCIDPVTLQEVPGGFTGCKPGWGK